MVAGKKKKRMVLWLLLLIVLPMADASEALASREQTIAVSASQDKLVLDAYLGVLADPEGTWTFADVSGDLSIRFQYPRKERHIYGYTDDAYWVKAVLLPQTSDSVIRLLEIGNPSLNRIDLYVKNGDEVRQYTAGDQLPFRDRPYNNRKFLFPLHLDPDRPTEIYARIEAGGIMYFPMTLWKESAYHKHELVVQTGWGFYLGCMAAMMVYHLMLFVLIRNRNDLLFALLILLIGLFQMADSGIAYALLWPDWPAWNEKSPNLLAAAGLFILSLLGRHLLRHGTAFNRYCDRVYAAFAGIALLCMPLLWLLDYADGILVLKLLFSPFLALTLLAVVSALRGKAEGAPYIAAALAGLFLGILISIFKGTLWPVNAVTGNAFKLGSVLFVMILSFGVGANLQRLQRESGRERKKRMQLELLYDYSRKMVTTLDPGEIGEIALTGMKEMVGASKGWLFSSAEQASDPVSEAVRNVVERTGPEPAPRLISDAEDPSKLGLPKEKGRYLAVPIPNQGQVLALAILLVERPFKLSEADLQPVSLLAAQAGKVLVNARRFMEKHQLAMLDELTGLLNRRAFFERARDEYRKCVEDGKPMTVMMIDADEFKQINDSYGHAAGDRLLKKLAGILRDNFKGKDVIGRYGGEEFSVAMPNTDLQKAEALAERLRREVEREGNIDGISRFTVSIGVSSVSLRTEDGTDALSEALLRADQALYSAKRQGRNRVARMEDETMPL